MSNISSIDVSASGLFAQRTKLDAIANNIANVSTTRTPAGGPYRRQQVLLAAHKDETGQANGGVEVEAVVDSADPPKMVYDPSHPDAGPDGMVAMPNVNIVQEMVDMITATRAYEANVQAITAAHSMASKALDLGRV